MFAWLACTKHWVPSLASHKLCMVMHVSSPSTGEIKQENQKFTIILNYILSQRQALATSDPVSKRGRKKEKQ